MFTCLEAEDEDGKGLFLAGLLSIPLPFLTRLFCSPNNGSQFKLEVVLIEIALINKLHLILNNGLMDKV